MNNQHCPPYDGLGDIVWLSIKPWEELIDIDDHFLFDNGLDGIYLKVIDAARDAHEFWETIDWVEGKTELLPLWVYPIEWPAVSQTVVRCFNDFEEPPF